MVLKKRMQVNLSIAFCFGVTDYGHASCLDRIYKGGEALCTQNAATGGKLTISHVIPKAEIIKNIVFVVGAVPA